MTMRGRAIVVGGGIVGLSLALGLARSDMEVLVLDGADDQHRASFGNAGLIWVQGKGLGSPAYAAWTRRSADLWPGFAAELLAATGIDTEYERKGGFNLCLSDAELAARAEIVRRMDGQPGDANQVALVERSFIRERLPKVGAAVIGASWCPLDGHVNPLLLSQALTVRARMLGVRLMRNRTARAIERAGERLMVVCGTERLAADRVVVAAGLATELLARTADMTVPIKPVRGQIVVTERLAASIAHPTPTTRQARAGSILFGNSHEEDVSAPRTTVPVLAGHAQRALAEFPFLASASVLRSWGAIRVMPRDGLPVYASSDTFPGAFAVACHSGVTLAAAHARIVGPAIAGNTLPPDVASLSSKRFDVPRS